MGLVEISFQTREMWIAERPFIELPLTVRLRNREPADSGGALPLREAAPPRNHVVHLEPYCVGPDILGTEPAADGVAFRGGGVGVWPGAMPDLPVLLLWELGGIGHEHGGDRDQSVSHWIILGYHGVLPLLLSSPLCLPTRIQTIPTTPRTFGTSGPCK